VAGEVNTQMGHPIPAHHNQHRIFAQSRTGLRAQIGVTALLNAHHVVSGSDQCLDD
jgi:hypothetical protein